MESHTSKCKSRIEAWVSKKKTKAPFSNCLVSSKLLRMLIQEESVWVSVSHRRLSKSLEVRLDLSVNGRKDQPLPFVLRLKVSLKIQLSMRKLSRLLKRLKRVKSKLKLKTKSQNKQQEKSSNFLNQFLILFQLYWMTNMQIQKFRMTSKT